MAVNPQSPAEILAEVARIEAGVASARKKGHKNEILDDLGWAVAQLRAALKREPDHCYDCNEPERSYPWKDRNDLLDDMPVSTGIMHIGTLIDGPEKWAIAVATEFDDDGDPDEWEMRWFDNEADAQAALIAARTAQGERHG